MIRRVLARLRGSSAVDEPLAPSAAFAVIGDIHGRSDLLQRLLAKLERGLPVVCVGDYIDRGADSAAVLRLLADRADIICLMGNHERMLLDFLDDPVVYGPSWLANGGLETLQSFGVSGLEQLAGPDTQATLIAGRDALAAAMGEGLIGWLSALPLYWQSGNVVVVHAAADPALAIDAQSPRTLLWGHPDFGRLRRKDGLWVVHGHTIVAAPQVKAGRIAIDTGAFATGRLTAALVSADQVTFLTG